MALAFTAPSPIAEVSDVDASSYTTTGTAGANNKLYLITVENSHATAPALPTLTHSGGLTCVEIANSLGSNRRVTLFRALKTTGVSAGTFTADAAGATQTSWSVVVDESSTEVDTTGTDGSGAIVQSDTSAGSGTTATGNLVAFGDAVNNAAFMATMNNLNSPISEEAGYTELADLGHANPTRRVETEYKLGEDTSVTSTFSSAAWHCIAVEVKAAAGGPGSQTVATEGIASAEAFGTLDKVQFIAKASGAIASGEAFGSAKAIYIVKQAGAVASGEAFGEPTAKSI